MNENPVAEDACTRHTQRMSWMHEIEMEVRDYELDLQGIVNNSVYMHYLEHARHRFIQSLGLDFHALHEQGVDPVVVRAEVDYKLSLTSSDRFIVRSKLEAMGKLRVVFVQEIVRNGRIRSKEAFEEAGPDLIVQARITAATLRNGRPAPCPEITAFAIQPEK